MSRPEPILVCFAVPSEAGPFRRLARQWPHVRLLLTGMGRANAARALDSALAQGRPHLVLSAGFAGGLNPQWPSGTVLFGPDSPPELLGALRAAGAQPGRFCCVPTVATTVQEKARLRAQSGADAVEMESQVIAQLCARQQVACATVRVILDSAGEDLPLDFNSLLNAQQQLDGAKLAWALVRSPAKIPALLRLQKQSSRAAKRLAEVLAHLGGSAGS